MNKRSHGVLYLLFFGIASVLVSTTAFATNGMNMEGYGPIATGMGGASMAYDNGVAAVMNNPATLGLMPEGDRLDVAVGALGPIVKVTETSSGRSVGSKGTAYYMPAMGWARKTGEFTYGLGMFGQGGMGTEYSVNSFMAYGSGDKVRSEVSMGRVLAPFAYEVNKDLSIGATLDFVWVGMDLKMAMPGMAFGDMVADLGGSQSFGTASGSMVDTLVDAFTVPQTMCGGVPCLSAMNWARYDFSDNNAFTGKAKGTGFAGKIGGVYKVSNEISVGGSYHSKTAISDLETKSATLSMNVVGPATMGQNATIPVTGTIKVMEFEWPQMLGMGMAYQVMDNLMIVADYKWINWADVMKNFRMTFEADATQSDPAATNFGLGGQSVDATLYQKWKDQNVFMIGAAYKVDTAITVRAGLNLANNPVPSQYLNALFPAIVKNHVTLGAGYMISKASTVDASFTYAPEVKQTSGSGITSKHAQTNAQAMYSYRF